MTGELHNVEGRSHAVHDRQVMRHPDDTCGAAHPAHCGRRYSQPTRRASMILLILMPAIIPKPVIGLITSATMLRLLVAAALPLGIDESYAAVVSRTLSLSYFDHPPAVFWMAHAAAWLGGESPFALRWPFVLLFALTSGLLYLLTARLFGARAGFWATLAAQVIPVFSLSSGSWVLPDGPLLCGSVAAALALSHAASVSRTDADGVHTAATHRTTWTPWLLLGLALGLAGLSKYHAALLGLGVAVFVLTDRGSRRSLGTVPPYVAVLIALLCVVPVFVWNAQHEWVSFRFQAGRAAGSGSPVTAVLQNLAGQAGYVLPWFWVPLVFVMVRGLRAGPTRRMTWFCCCLGAAPVLVFTLASLGGRAGLPHWPAPGFFLLLPLLGDAIARWELRTPQTARRSMTGAVVMFVALLGIVVSHAATGWVANVVPSLHTRDPAFELLEYRSLRDSLTARGLLAPARFLATADWMRAAKIGYALGPARPVLVLNDDARHFRFAFDADTVVARDGLLLLKVPSNVAGDSATVLAAPQRSRFERLEYVGVMPVLRGADTALTLAVFTAWQLRRGWSLPSAVR